MSVLFEIGGQSVWWPSERAGQAYLACARALGTLVSVSPGLVYESDTVAVDPLQFAQYCEALQALCPDVGQRHRVLSDLVDAVLIPGLVMLERAGADRENLSDATRASIRHVGATMAT